MAANGTGWGGVFSAYPIRKLGKGCILPGISLIISILAYYFGSVNDPIMLMAKIADIIISGFPSIIGFVLTGYALIIGFSSTELIGRMACIKVTKNHSYFEVVSAIFAIVLGIVVTTYILACIVTFVIHLNIVSSCGEKCVTFFNTICLFAFLFVFYYSIFSLLDIIVNVFNIGEFANAVAQTNHSEPEVRKDGLLTKILRYIFGWS